MDSLSKFIRSVTRPALVLLALVATIAFVWTAKEIPEPWWLMAGGAMGWWFYSRERGKKPTQG